MGGPGSGRREGNPAENRKKKAKTKLLTVRMWDWQYKQVAADAEAAGVNISEHTLTKLEVPMGLLSGVYAEVKKVNIPGGGYYFQSIKGNWAWGNEETPTGHVPGVSWMYGTVSHEGYDYYTVLGGDGKIVDVCENGEKWFLGFRLNKDEYLKPPKGLETFKVA